jgi:hypothetical protein
MGTDSAGTGVTFAKLSKRTFRHGVQGHWT